MWLKCMQRNQYSVETFAHQSAAYGFEAYLEQSSPVPPPCTPTILREFSADSAVL